MMGLIKNLKTKYDIQAWFLCCDYSGENVDFERICKQEEMGMEFKYSATGTLQQNGHDEWKL